MRIEKFSVGILGTNCYLAVNEETLETVIVDPGACPKKLLSYIAEENLKPAAILLTHGHFDHIWGAQKLRELSGAKIYACREEEKLLLDAGMKVA